ncbi:hypothetical protein ScPMuIL_006201 [Solemya velum]
MDLGLNLEDEDFNVEQREGGGDALKSYNAKFCPPLWFKNVSEAEQQEELQSLKYEADYLYCWGDFPGAATSYRRSLDLLPANNVAMRHDMTESLARCYLYQKKFPEALDLARSLDSSASNEDHQVQALNLLCQVHHAMSEYPDEIRCLQKLIEFHPHNYQFWIKLAQCYQQTYENPKKTLIFHVSNQDSTEYNLSESPGYHSDNSDPRIVNEPCANLSKQSMQASAAPSYHSAGPYGHRTGQMTGHTEEVGGIPNADQSSSLHKTHVDNARRSSFEKETVSVVRLSDIQATFVTDSKINDDSGKNSEAGMSKTEVTNHKIQQLATVSMDTVESSSAEMEYDAVLSENIVNNDCRTCDNMCLPNERATTSCLQISEQAATPCLQISDSAYGAGTQPGPAGGGRGKSGVELMCSCVASAASCVHTEEKLRALTCLVRARLLLIFAHGKASGFIKARDQKVKQEVEDGIINLGMNESTLKKLEKFLMEDINSAVNTEGVTSETMCTDGGVQDFDRRWFSWTKDRFAK